jgi:predicted PP-loop superfamily ATPase
MLFASCQSSTDTKQILSKSETRKDMMDKIANDSSMSKEMMGAMMASQTGTAMMHDHQKMMMGNHETMMKMMKDNPGMMEGMMTNMMDACKNDTAMMSGMCKAMMENKPMMDMMQKMKGMDMGKLKGMDTTKAKDHTLHH